jgi:hypothetical protein
VPPDACLPRLGRLPRPAAPAPVAAGLPAEPVAVPPVAVAAPAAAGVAALVVAVVALTGAVSVPADPAVVLKWSRVRNRYERQGLLVEAQGLEKAEQECLADNEIRARRREREAVRRQETDSKYVEEFAARVRELFPHCPAGREREVAEHACLKYSGRIGRSALAKAMDEAAVRLVVIAHVRHRETKYDELLAKGCERREARTAVEETACRVLQKWEAR